MLLSSRRIRPKEITVFSCRKKLPANNSHPTCFSDPTSLSAGGRSSDDHVLFDRVVQKFGSILHTQAGHDAVLVEGVHRVLLDLVRRRRILDQGDSTKLLRQIRLLLGVNLFRGIAHEMQTQILFTGQ